MYSNQGKDIIRDNNVNKNLTKNNDNDNDNDNHMGSDLCSCVGRDGKAVQKAPLALALDDTLAAFDVSDVEPVKEEIDDATFLDEAKEEEETKGACEPTLDLDDIDPVPVDNVSVPNRLGPETEEELRARLERFRQATDIRTAEEKQAHQKAKKKEGKRRWRANKRKKRKEADDVRNQQAAAALDVAMIESPESAEGDEEEEDKKEDLDNDDDDASDAKDDSFSHPM